MINLIRPWWDSLESVSKVNGWLLAFVAAFGFLAAVASIAAWFTGNRLSELQADRHINSEQREKMLAILKPQPETRVAVAFLTPASSDAQEYAMEIGGVLHDAKFTVVPYPWLTTEDKPVHGFAVEVRETGSGSKQRQLESEIKEALSVLDDRITVTRGGSDPNGELKLDLLILVGNK
jgi:hypothetical protein